MTHPKVEYPEQSIPTSKTEEPLRVAVNAVPLLSPTTGIAQYVKSLMQTIESTGQIEPYYFYAGGWGKKLRTAPLPPAADQLKLWVRQYLPKSYELNRWMQQRRFISGLKGWKADLYHEPNILSFEFDGPTVLTVHDLSWIRYPETHPAERVRAMNKYFEPSLTRATQIITDSHFVKQELIEIFGIPSQKIHAIHLAADPIFKPLTNSETKSTLHPLGLKHGEYWLAVGTLEPRKNLQLLLDAFSRIDERQRKRCPLVLVGMMGWENQNLKPQLKAMVRSGEVIYTGYLPRPEQAQVVAGAKALIYPSLYEGFGLPLVEAMQCGIPVIAANTSCLPEVVSEAGILIDPYDPEALVQVMSWVEEDRHEHQEMATRAIRQGREFSWESCAEQTIAVYHRACRQ